MLKLFSIIKFAVLFFLLNNLLRCFSTVEKKQKVGGKVKTKRFEGSGCDICDAEYEDVK